MLLGKSFNEIDASTIKSLIELSVAESVYLDIKQETYGNADKDKKEFLKDISSLANCLGGYLIIGIKEAEGIASSVAPLPRETIDKELLRLESIIITGVEPTIVGIQMKRLDIDDGSIIIIHVPRSFKPPHRVVFKNANRYYSRHSAGVYELSIEELRLLFGEQRSIEEKVKQFVRKRFLLIQANDGPIPIAVEKGVLVMHLVPLSDFGASRRIEIATLRKQHSFFAPIGTQGGNQRINLDGFTVFRGGELCHGYTQIFRDGSIESTKADVFSEHGGARLLASRNVPNQLLDSLSLFMKGLKLLDCSPPIVLAISFSGMNGVELGLGKHQYSEIPPPYKKSELRLPHTIILNFSDTDNYESIIAEQMDLLWNVFDLERCPYFDEDGRWIQIE